MIRVICLVVLCTGCVDVEPYHPRSRVSFAEREVVAPLTDGVGVFSDLIFADIDGDGVRDLAYSRNDGSIAVQRGSGGLRYAPPTLSPPRSSNITTLGAAALDGQPGLELVGMPVDAYRWDAPTGQLVAMGVFNVGQPTVHGIVADIDDDGVVEAWWTQPVAGSPVIEVAPWNGVRFVPSAPIAAGTSAYSGVLTLTDADGDGHDDVMLLPELAPDGNTRALRFFWGGATPPPDVIVSCGAAGDAVVVDFDGDGQADIVATVTGAVVLCRGLGEHAFAPPEMLMVNAAAPYSKLLFVDVDLDGHPDLALWNDGAHTLTIFRSDRGVRFDAVGIELALPQLSSVVIDDLDGDGLRDMVIFSIEGLSYYRNTSE